MFNRKEESWHDLNPVDEINRKRFKDDYSSKYLNRVYNPEFRMRVREKDEPKVSMLCGMIGLKVKHSSERKWIF